MGIKRQRTASSVLSSHSGDDSALDSDSEKPIGSTLKKPPKQAAAPKQQIKTENKGSSTTPAAQQQQPEQQVVKRRGGRRNGGNADGEQRDLSSGANGADKNWTCHCGLWTCLCGPSLTRGDTVSNSQFNANSNSNGAL